MKCKADVSSSRRKSRKLHFAAPSSVRHKIMSAHLSKELREKWHVRAMPIRLDDEVVIKRGRHKGQQGRVINVYRKKWSIAIDRQTREKQNRATVPLAYHPSKVEIVKLSLNDDRKKVLARKSSERSADKGKITEAEVS